MAMNGHATKQWLTKRSYNVWYVDAALHEPYEGAGAKPLLVALNREPA